MVAGCGVDRRGPRSGGNGGVGSGGAGRGEPAAAAAATAFAPNGALPLYDAIVYVPSSPVAPFPEGVTCDR